MNAFQRVWVTYRSKLQKQGTSQAKYPSFQANSQFPVHRVHSQAKRPRTRSETQARRRQVFAAGKMWHRIGEYLGAYTSLGSRKIPIKVLNTRLALTIL
jgi:hypothetical protein